MLEAKGRGKAAQRESRGKEESAERNRVFSLFFETLFEYAWHLTQSKVARKH